MAHTTTRPLRQRVAPAVGAALLATTMTPGVAGAAPGDLDRGFGDAGTAVVRDEGEGYALGVAVQPDGRIVAAGEWVNAAGVDRALVFRLMPDGRLDTAFGIRKLPGPGGADARATSVALQPDGRIVVAGNTDPQIDGAVWRLRPDGTPDTTFGGGDGLVLIGTPAESQYLSDVAVAPGGKVVVAGSTTQESGKAAIYRLTADGDPDNSFDTDGQIGLGAPNSSAKAVAVRPDGAVLVAGNYGGAEGSAVRMLDPAGEPVLSFGGGDGQADIADTKSAQDLALLPDGRMVVVGSRRNPEGLGDDMFVTRYTANGLVDPGFGSPDLAGTRLDLGGEEALASVALTPAGGVVAAGTTDVGFDAVLAKLTADGRPDTAFGPSGVRRIGAGMEYGEGVAVQADGKIVGVGGDDRAHENALVYRFVGDHRAPAAATCQGRRATVVGTPGRDRIAGTARADVIVALGGDDVVAGRGGKDLVCAGDGRDTVRGGSGNDALYGMGGPDRLYGGAGRDRVVGGTGKDVQVP